MGSTENNAPTPIFICLGKLHNHIERKKGQFLKKKQRINQFARCESYEKIVPKVKFSLSGHYLFNLKVEVKTQKNVFCRNFQQSLKNIDEKTTVTS